MGFLDFPLVFIAKRFERVAYLLRICVKNSYHLAWDLNHFSLFFSPINLAKNHSFWLVHRLSPLESQNRLCSNHTFSVWREIQIHHHWNPVKWCNPVKLYFFFMACVIRVGTIPTNYLLFVGTVYSGGKFYCTQSWSLFHD